MASIIQLRRGTAAEWTTANPILASGEQGFETDTKKEKIGDGVTAWNSLAYKATSGGPTSMDDISQATGSLVVVDIDGSDTIPVSDVSSAGVFKRFTLQHLGAWMQGVFDTIYQSILVSGTNIKTINNQSLLGSGNISTDENFKGLYISLVALNISHPTASPGDYADVDAGVGSDVERYIWDADDFVWVLQGSDGGTETPTSIKTKYESNSDTNGFTDAEKAKLATLHEKNVDKGVFNGVFDMDGKNNFYDDYLSGGVVNLSLSTIKTLGSFCRVRILGGLIGTIPPELLTGKTGDEISVSPLKLNEITLMYVRTGDTPMVVRTFDVPDTENPTQPQNVVASNVTDTTFDLNWDDSSDNVLVSSYDVFLGGVLNQNVSVSNASITGLTGSTGYTVTVQAIDSSGNRSQLSTAFIVNTDVPNLNPTQPTNVVASNILETSFDLNWTASTDPNGTVDSYNIYLGGVFEKNVLTNSGSITGLTGGTSYSVTIEAVDNDSNVSPLSSALGVNTSSGAGVIDYDFAGTRLMTDWAILNPNVENVKMQQNNGLFGEVLSTSGSFPTRSNRIYNTRQFNTGTFDFNLISDNAVGTSGFVVFSKDNSDFAGFIFDAVSNRIRIHSSASGSSYVEGEFLSTAKDLRMVWDGTNMDCYYHNGTSYVLIGTLSAPLTSPQLMFYCGEDLINNEFRMNSLSISNYSETSVTQDPLTILPTLSQWYDGQDSSSMDIINTDEVAVLYDKKLFYSMAGQTNNPTFLTDHIGFDGTGSLRNNVDVNPLLNHGQDFHGFMVFRNLDLLEGSYYINSQSTSDRFAISLRNGELGVGTYNGSAFNTKSAVFSDVSNYHKLEFKIISGVVTAYLDDVLMTGTNTIYTSVNNEVNIGGTGTGSYKQMDFKDFFVIEGEMTTQERTNALAYISTKHSL